MKKYSYYDYPFYMRSNENPYITKRQMAIIYNVLQIKDVEKRMDMFIARGFNVKRPKCYQSKEVYAIIVNKK